MTDTFIWKGQVATSGNGTFAMRAANFGEGYSQTVPLGMNNESQKWSVVIEGYRDQVMPALNFIRAVRGGSFLWTPPLGDEGYYHCPSYSTNDKGGAYFQVTFQFEQGYAP